MGKGGKSRVKDLDTKKQEIIFPSFEGKVGFREFVDNIPRKVSLFDQGWEEFPIWSINTICCKIHLKKKKPKCLNSSRVNVQWKKPFSN